ncbi:MAG: hypothetical protein COT09_05540 [Candidatus Hydromicrobium americanum]|nr:MAG: hypothetical protein COT09_05540 [Candidatus Hydromicrobium americanum]
MEFVELRRMVDYEGGYFYDMMGQLVEERFFADAQNDRLEIGKDLPAGIYFVKVKGYKSTKIIKLK